MNKKILIINQHGENRGDEAAMRAMLAGFSGALDDIEFTLLYQFRDPNLRLDFSENVTDLPIVLPPLHYVGLGIFTLGKLVGLNLRFCCSAIVNKMLDAYEQADLVVSAPGGPYFGDIYAGHEPVHWWFVYLAVVFKKRLFLYATSAGPFKNKFMNPIRRWLYPKFDKLVVREELSAELIKNLLGEDVEIVVTADSAIQQEFSSSNRRDYFAQQDMDIGNRLLVAVSLNDYGYPRSDNAEALSDHYKACLQSTLAKLHHENDAYFLFFPQLYGATHNDVDFLRDCISAMPEPGLCQVVDPDASSDTQRELIGMCDIHIASRYHPAIFANTAMVPGICIYYEHKALGFMRQLELERYAFDIYDLSENDLIVALRDIISNRENLVSHLESQVPVLRARSRKTTQLAVDLLMS